MRQRVTMAIPNNPGPGLRHLIPGKRIVMTELFPEGELITFDDGSEAVYPRLIDPAEADEDHSGAYMELFPNDPETHHDNEAFASRAPLCLTPAVLRAMYPERERCRG